MWAREIHIGRHPFSGWFMGNTCAGPLPENSLTQNHAADSMILTIVSSIKLHKLLKGWRPRSGDTRPLFILLPVLPLCKLLGTLNPAIANNIKHGTGINYSTWVYSGDKPDAPRLRFCKQQYSFTSNLWEVLKRVGLRGKLCVNGAFSIKKSMANNHST